MAVLNGLVHAVGPSARTVEPGDLAHRLLGLDDALRAMGHAPGRRYRVALDRNLKGWHLVDLGESAPPRVSDGRPSPVPTHAWDRGAYLLAREEDDRRVLAVAVDSRPVEAGTRVVALLGVFYEDGSLPTWLRVEEGPVRVRIEGTPNPVALLAALSEADVQHAVLGGTARPT
ncbi:MAG: hypothetical protein Q8P41_14145 [Pseudomonadota bacterium]|nr:hypothetical protein [Pseudomonadota bacterium]